jgi:hypothetical protein
MAEEIKNNESQDDLLSAFKLPEIYSDRMRSTLSIFGATLTFGISEPHPDNSDEETIAERIRIRMSLEHAKLMVMILKRQIKKFEENNKISVQIPDEVFEKLKLNKEDW